MDKFLSFLSLILVLISSARALDVQAPQAYMVDFNTGVVLLEKNADQPMAPSSMSKIMTAHLVFDRLKKGEIKLDDLLFVDEEAWKMGGSKMFVQLNSQVSVEDLLQGVIVQSGNDACIVLAKGLAGSEIAFAEEMTQKAHEMGAKNSNFVNASGWPAEGHVSTARDLAIMADRTIRDFPEEYAKYYGMKDFTYNNIKQGNRNTLLDKNMGADGVKTGHSDPKGPHGGGYGTVVSAEQGGRRLILVINGLPSMKARDQEATTLLNWGFTYFKNYKLFGKGDVVDVADVWGGVEKTVPLVSSQDIVQTLPRNQRKDLQVKVVYDSPLTAPIKAGDEVGVLEVTIPEKGVQKIPLHAIKDVKQAWFFQRIGNSVYYLLWGKHSS
jgi:D-alanyl-D-alanine carboxypeptidase (penicillin-binding protein 5/6)